MKKNKIHLVKQLFLMFFLYSIGLNAHALSAKEEVQDNYRAWCHAIGTAKGNPNDIVRFYAPGAILLPTLSSKILENTNGGLNSYFINLTSYPNIKCHTQKLITHIHGHIATNSGLYTFSYTGKDGKTVKIPARFTFVYKKHDNYWWIIKHHSSKLP